MNRRRKTTAAVAALVLLSVTLGGFFGYLLGRGRTAAPDGAPRAQRSEVEEVGTREPEAPAEAARQARAHRIRLALQETETADAEARAWALRTLLDAGYDHAEIVRLVVRPKVPGWQGRAIADLLSSEPEKTLPPLLHHLTYAAPLQRMTICDALGAPREDVRAASAVLAVRALLDSYAGAREHALAALRGVDAAGAKAVYEQYAQGGVLTDGSVARLDAALLVEEGCPYASGLARLAFLDALEAEGARFGNATVIRIGAFLAPLPDGEPWFRDAIEQLLAYDDLDEEGAALLVTAGPRLVPLLRGRLKEPGARAWVADMLGRLGPYARDAAPDLLPLIHDEEMGAHVAWALGAMGATSPEAVDALCVRLTHRITMGLDALQAEGALKRVLAEGSGYERVAALLESETESVVRAGIRILSLCHARDRVATLALLDRVLASDPGRPLRRTVGRASRLLSAGEEVREAERQWQLSGLARALDDP